MILNPVCADPAPYDDAFPPTSRGLELTSHGHTLLGVMYSPAGPGPHPLAILLHGFPGHERNLDLAQVLRRAGWHALVFHYRGSWGSGGDYRFAHVLEDTLAVIDSLCTPLWSEQLAIDPARIALIGHSLGGWAALMAAARSEVWGACAVAAVDLGMWGALLDELPESVPETRRFFATSLPPLHGATADGLMDEIIRHAADWSLTGQAAALATQRLYLIAAERDETVAPALHHHPLVAALGRAGAAHLRHETVATDHSFNDRRIALARLLLDWLPPA
jgi:uncharacterized protein